MTDRDAGIKALSVILAVFQEKKNHSRRLFLGLVRFKKMFLKEAFYTKTACFFCLFAFKWDALTFFHNTAVSK